MRKILLAATVGVVLALPATAGASLFRGVVISRSSSDGELVIAAKNGKTMTVRTSSLVTPGAVISASTRALGDGTFSVSHLSVLGRSVRASFRGVFVKRAGSSSFFSAGRSIVVVDTAAVRGLASARTDTPLQPGQSADVNLTIGPQGTLTANSLTPVGQAAEKLVLQVTVTSVTPATATAAGSLTLQVNGQALVIPLPVGTVLPASVIPAATVNVTIDFGQGGVAANAGPGAGNGDDEDQDEDEDDDDGNASDVHRLDR
jgi:hypothetical protein